MKEFYKVLVQILVLCIIQTTQGQNNEGLPCDTPNQDYGICTNLNRCPLLLNLLLAKGNDPNVVSYLRASACGFVGKDPLVCCPTKKNQTSRPPVSPATPASVAPPVTVAPTETPTSAPASPRTTTDIIPKYPNCGTVRQSDVRIVNGVPAKLGEFPWMVALGYRNSKNAAQPKWLCGGSLITSRHILTAGHCVHNRNDLYLARLGDLDLYSDDDGASPETISLIKAKIHEEYSPVTFTNDIAILTLAESPKNSSISPICLPIDNANTKIPRSFVNLSPFVAGWGAVSFNGPTSPILMKTLIPIVENSKCQRAFEKSRGIIDDRVLCAGYTHGGKDACQGDSGGPLMYGQSRNSNGTITFYQIGVVSYGFKCAEAGYPGVYTKVTRFMDWIERNLD